VRRLQVRIVKAVKAGKWRQVKNLQRLLSHSLSGRCLAVRRVTENRGNRTAGVDKVLWDTPEKKIRAVYALKKTGYKAQPLLRIYIPKSNGKRRPLGIPTMFDRAQQALHLLSLDPVAETLADKNSYGFRRERSPADAIGQVFNNLRFRTCGQWILEGDIRSCFDEIDHDWMLSNIPMDKNILRKWLKSGYMERDVFYHTRKGTPQGGIVSPVLSNMTLDGLERVIKEASRKHDIRANFVRFADDFVVISHSKPFLEEILKPLINGFFKERGLTLSEEKTLITHIDDGFDFLGQHIRKYNGKLLIKPSKKSIKSFLDEVTRMGELPPPCC
jgi:RNA-directed DNA polymerase